MKLTIARGAVHAERILSNPMNLIRVMPAKGSGLLGTEVSEHEEWPDAAFPYDGEAAFFFCFLSRGKNMEIAVRINGKEDRLKECTIEDLIAGKSLVAASLVVEYNGRIVKQADWSKVTLNQGDVLELLNFVGGG